MLTGLRLAQMFEADASAADVALRRLATPVSKYHVAKRGPLWGKVQGLIYDEVPFVEVGKFNALSARSAKLQGYAPMPWPFFWNTSLAK